MINMLRWIRKYILLALVLAYYSSDAQTFKFRNYDSNMGLPQNFIYALEQGSDGFLWIGTGEGLVRYDGLKFTSYSTRDSLADNFVMSMQEDSEGTLWIGHNNGDLTYLKDRQFTPVRLPETNSPIRDINHDNQGNTWVTVQNSGFAKIDKYNNVTTWFDTGSLGYTLFYSIYPLDNNTILLGTSEGLMRLTVTNEGKIQQLEKFNEIPLTTITSITPRKGIQDEFWIATEDEGFFKFALSQSHATQIIDKSLCLTFNLGQENIQDIEEEDEGHLLLATWGNGVIKLFYDAHKQEFTESFTFSVINGMSNDFVKDLLADTEGNYWFATYGGGVSSLVDESMVFYDLETIGFQDNKANSVFHANNRLWIGLENGIIVADPYCFTDFEFYDIEMGIPRDVVTGFYADSVGTIWVSTKNNGLFYREKNESNFSRWYYTSSTTGKMINDITGKRQEIYLATVGGFFQLDTNNKSVMQLTTENGLPHNNINFVYSDRNGELWIGPKNSGICRIDAQNIEIHRITETPSDIFDMTHDLEGSIWLATQGRGILKYQEDSLTYIDVAHGLSKNFCYNIIADQQNRLWVTHFPGLSSLDLKSEQIRTYDYEQNLGVDFYNSSVDSYNNIWFASSKGVINYFPSKDVENEVAPNLNFTSVKVSGHEHNSLNDLVLPYPYKDKYTFRFEFIGISFKDPKAVTYQYRLTRHGDSEEAKWMDLGNTSFREYEYLPDGDYLLQIRAFNADGIYNKKPLSIRIYIAPPVWKKLWFYLVLVGIIGYSIFLLIRIRERKLLRQKEALQREVESQTITLREQKAEIERKNRDITDSINYAKRIQSSILPESAILEKTFSESFIYFAPRDIVSGDFYWFHPFKDKFLVGVADCTGHGVPGAFMSMIGTTLLNDIVKREEVESPADILHRLDLEIKILLQKNEVEFSRDGMDISIVEIDLHSNRVRLASAKRPVYLYINGEFTVYKGNRRSIGDTIMEDNSEFVNIAYETGPSDCIYLFSDGYCDQFGGPDGKKFMSTNVRKLLMEINDKTMREQAQIIEETFTNWKGDEDQVDDVVFMGIRL
jgi:ligand-binding sensor domain-containing protein/serine phosphatase RsbU (regulator of sigma subunit)